MPNPVVWFEVMGQNGDKMRRFYGDVLGWEFDLSASPDYGVVIAGEGGIGGGIGQATPDHPGWVTFYTEVPDLEATIEKALSRGSRVLMPVTQLPDTTIAVVADPEGRPVGLCTRAD